MQISNLVIDFSLFVLQAAWGGSVLFSKKHKHLIAGIERYIHITFPHFIISSTKVTCTVNMLLFVPKVPSRDMRVQIETVQNKTF